MLEPLDPSCPGVPFSHDERLDRRAAQALVEGRPHHDAVGALAGGDVDLLAVDDVLVAVLAGGGLDVRGVRAGAGLGDRHRGPGAGEALELLVVGDRGDRGVAEPLARHRQQQADVAPAHLHDGQHRGEVGAVLVARASSSGFSSRRTPAAPAPPVAPDSEMPSIMRGEHVEFLGVLVLGLVVLARDRAAACSSRPGAPGRRAGGSSWGLEVDHVFSGSVVEPSTAASDQDRSFHESDGPQVAVPPLDRVLLDEAVPTEQLDAVEADLHALARRTAGGPGRSRARPACPAATRLAAR